MFWCQVHPSHQTQHMGAPRSSCWNWNRDLWCRHIHRHQGGDYRRGREVNLCRRSFQVIITASRHRESHHEHCKSDNTLHDFFHSPFFNLFSCLQHHISSHNFCQFFQTISSSHNWFHDFSFFSFLFSRFCLFLTIFISVSCNLIFYLSHHQISLI